MKIKRNNPTMDNRFTDTGKYMSNGHFIVLSEIASRFKIKLPLVLSSCSIFDDD